VGTRPEAEGFLCETWVRDARQKAGQDFEYTTPGRRQKGKTIKNDETLDKRTAWGLKP